MSGHAKLEQWRKDAFQIYYPDWASTDQYPNGPFPNDEIAVLSREHFADPYQAYAAVRNDNEQWTAFVSAAEPLLRDRDIYDQGEAVIHAETAENALASYMERARERMMQDIRERVGRASRELGRGR